MRSPLKSGDSSSWSIWRWTPGPASARADVAVLEALTSEQGAWTGIPVAVTRSRLRQIIEDGLITQAGAPIKPGARLREGVAVEARFPPPQALNLELGPLAQARPLDVLFEDEHLLVLNKPPGLTVHPSTTQMDDTLVHALVHHVKDLSGIGGTLRPGIVHRIDKDTSGALVITKSDAAHQALAKVFVRHEIERAYWALVYGAPAERGPIRIESLIGRNPKDRKKMSMEVKEGRRAVSFITRLEEYGTANAKPFASLVEARLETGRTHQIRVHLTGMGHSLLGDPTYGTPSGKATKWLAMPANVREAVEAMPGQALHARVLGFTHPITGARLRFEAPAPPSFELLRQALARYR